VIATLAVFLDVVLRFLALAALLAAVLVALTHWAVRAGHLEPFATFPRVVRRWSDPVLRPFEQRLVRRGLNPQDAPLWLLGVVVVAGILLVTGSRWLIRFLYSIAALRYATLTQIVAFVLDVSFSVLMLALLVRVIGSWLGAGRASRAVAWSYRLTDWLVEPIRRRLPPVGPFDLSPVAAYFGLVILRGILFALL